MKWLLPLILAGMLAGCTASDDPDGPEGTSSDGPSMYVPAPGSDADEMLGPDDTRPADGEGFAPQQGRYEAFSDELGLVAEFFTEECGAVYCIHAVATNEGSDDLYVNDICITPWSESMQQRDSDVEKAAPVATCMAWGVGAMAPAEMLDMDFTWDARLWDGDAGEYRDAPEDSYTWSIHFAYYMDADGGDRQEVVVDVPLIIGET